MRTAERTAESVHGGEVVADGEKHFDDAKGKAKEAFGKVTGDESSEADGKMDQAKSQVKDAAEKAKNKAKESASEAIGKIRDSKR